MAKPKLIARYGLRHGYLDGDGKLVEVVYAEGEAINEELFDEESLAQLRKSGAVVTKKELEATAVVEAEVPGPLPVKAPAASEKKSKAK
jgi:hypothetical protein